MKELPFVTTMIVVRNEEKYIKKCLESFLEQEYPKDKYEILVIDGCSTDKTIDIVKETIKMNQDVKVTILKNEKKLLASGWNLGIKYAKGEYVVRLDAHGYAEKDFLINSVKTMLEIKDAVCVGGAMQTKALNSKGDIIANILSSPFGVGNSKFRYSDKAEYVDTVAFGLYKKAIFQKVGYFDETLKRNQDNDMHHRIREVGEKFYLNPKIKTVYYCRDSIKGMFKQAYLNGKWNIITFYKDKSSLSIRHLIPLTFVCGILFCMILGYFYNIFLWLLLGVLILHLILGIYFSTKKTKRIYSIIKMTFYYMGLHISYGLGSILSIISLPLYIKKEKVSC